MCGEIISRSRWNLELGQSLNSCIILVGVGRIYSIQRFRGSWLKGVVKKFRGDLDPR